MRIFKDLNENPANITDYLTRKQKLVDKYLQLKKDYADLRKQDHKAGTQLDNLFLKAVKTRFVPVDRVPKGKLVRPRYSFRTVSPKRQDPQSGWNSVNFKTHNPFEVLPIVVDEDEFLMDDISKDVKKDVKKDAEIKKQSKKRKRQITPASASSLSIKNGSGSGSSRGSYSKVKPKRVVKRLAGGGKGKKKKAKGNVAAFGKGAANAGLPAREASKNPPRKQSNYNMGLRKLEKFSINTWNIGVLESKLKRNEKSLNSFESHVFVTMKGIVKAVNNLKRLSQLAVKCIIEIASKDVEKCHLLQGKFIEYHYLPFLDLVGLTENEGGISFWNGLMNALRLRKRKSKSKCALIQYFLNLKDENGAFVVDEFFLDNDLGRFLNHRIIEANAGELASSFRGQVIGKLPLILSKLLDEYYDDAVKLHEIEIISQSTQYVMKYLQLNIMLQSPWSLPMSTISDSFVSFTEAGLINLLDDDILEKETGLIISKGSGKNPVDKPSWLDDKAQSMIEPQGSFWKFLFGPKLGG